MFPPLLLIVKNHQSQCSLNGHVYWVSACPVLKKKHGNSTKLKPYLELFQTDRFKNNNNHNPSRPRQLTQ